jgi:hypothetical protein
MNHVMTDLASKLGNEIQAVHHQGHLSNNRKTLNILPA